MNARIFSYVAIALAVMAYGTALTYAGGMLGEIASDAGNACLLSACVALLLRIDRRGAA